MHKQQYTVDFENEECVLIIVKNVWADDATNAIFEASKYLIRKRDGQFASISEQVQWRCIGVDRQSI